MSGEATLDQVEQLVAQLTPRDQIKLIARISQRLSERRLPETNEERWQLDYAARVEVFLKMSNEMAAETVGKVESSDDIRQIREDRTSQL